MKVNPENLTEADQKRFYAAADLELRRELPLVWNRNPHFGKFDNADCFDNHRDGVRVIREVFMNDDGHIWLHVSVSMRGGTTTGSASARLPDWKTMDRVKRQFIGDDRVAYQIHPKREEHFTAHEVLHLWCPLDYSPIGDLRHPAKGL
jgi:hypothetical protein